MKRGISINRDYDYQGIPCVVIKKKRGKLTLPEITDTLHYGDRQCWVGRYVILLDCTEVTMGGNGCLDMMDEDPGDAHAWRGTGHTSALLTSPGSWTSFQKSAGRNSMKRCGRSSRP